jgi:hypothetical protein
MLVRWRRLVAFDLGFWTHTLVVGEDHAIAGLRAPSDGFHVAAFLADSFARCESGGRGASQSQRPNLARLRHADEHQECPLIGADRKGPPDGQSDAIDPGRTSRSFAFRCRRAVPQQQKEVRGCRTQSSLVATVPT